MKYVLAAIAALVLNACALAPTQISGGSSGGLSITSPTVVTDLQSAAFNLDQAVAVGALPPDDPAPKCLHDVLVKAGIEQLPGTVAPKTFTPKYDGLASAGAVAYILARQAQAAAPVPISMNCEQLVGRVVIDGAKAARKAAVSIVPGILR